MMNATTSLITDPEEQWKFKLITYCNIANYLVNFILGFPLNVYVIILLLGRKIKVDYIEVFTLNQAISEIFFMFLGPFHSLCYVTTSLCFSMPLGFFLGSGMSMRSMCQVMVCMERYVAVIHPIGFLKFRHLGYRVGFSIMAWIIGLSCGVASMFTYPKLPYKIFVVMYAFILTVDIFFCLRILKKLKHPGPGDRDRERESTAKKKAFQVITINMLIFLFQNIPLAVVFIMHDTLSLLRYRLAIVISLGFNIALGFVQPVFIIHKAGKLSFIKCTYF